MTWSDGVLATLTYLGDAAYRFHASLFGADGMAAGAVAAGAESYAAALTRILDMLETRTPPLSEQQMLRPIAMVHAIQQSLASGQVVELDAVLTEKEG